MNNKYVALVVPHTHWDREWYSPFQTFRKRLVRLVDRLLAILDADPAYRCFTLDGQTIVLDDYLEVRPEKEPEIRRYVEEGRLLIGPWYLLPDEFLVSGESLVRNLMRGLRRASVFGRAMQVGYAPDAFGHVGQLPQILQGFGMDNAIFTRGATADPACDKTEFLWSGAAGAPVLAVHQVRGYGNFADLPKEDAAVVQYAKESIRALEPHLTGSIIVLNAGTDHLEADPRLPRLIRLLNENIPEAEFRHAHYEEVVAALRPGRDALPHYRGELPGGRFHPNLPGVYSARMPIKQKNAACGALLEWTAEPLAAMSWGLGRGEYPRALLDIAWGHLIQNHPHDSICGCGIDEVADEMMPRFEQCLQIAESAALDGMMEMCSAGVPDAGAVDLRVFNALGWERTDLCRALVPAAALRETGGDAWVVEASDGAVTPAQVCLEPPVRIRGEVDWTEREMVEVAFVARDVPPFGYRTYALRTEKENEAAATTLRAADFSAENEFLVMRMYRDGTLDVTDKRTGKVFKDIAYLEDTGDGGDEYDYSPLDEDKPVTSLGGRAQLTQVETGPAAATFRAEFAMRLPEAIRMDRKGRAARRAVCPVCVEASLAAGAPRIELKVTFGNNARDHRLRIVFPSGIKAKTAAAESAFEVVERPVAAEPRPEWDQPPQPTHPQQTFADVSDGACGLAIINRGLPEYEAKSRRGGVALYVTLLRCVEWMSRPDLKTRRSDAGPMVRTPGAQCPGAHEFHLAIAPHSGDWREGGVTAHAHAVSAPLRVVAAGAFFGRSSLLSQTEHPRGVAFRASGSSAGEKHPPRDFCFLKPDAESVVTALKKAESEDALIVRFYRIGPEGHSVIEFAAPVSEAILVNLNEQPVPGNGRLTVDGRIVRVKAVPFEIVTMRVRLTA